jgi:hypothetical protein
MSIPPFAELVARVARKPPPDSLICLDPGETTGYARFEGSKLVAVDQIDTRSLIDGVQTIAGRIARQKPSLVIIENYLVYAHKSREHSWQALHTPQFIGMLKLACWQAQVPIFLQMAGTAKGFADDEKLIDWGMYHKGKRHARDAIRHGIYYILFNGDPIPDWRVQPDTKHRRI